MVHASSFNFFSYLVTHFCHFNLCQEDRYGLQWHTQPSNPHLHSMCWTVHGVTCGKRSHWSAVASDTHLLLISWQARCSSRTVSFCGQLGLGLMAYGLHILCRSGKIMWTWEANMPISLLMSSSDTFWSFRKSMLFCGCALHHASAGSLNHVHRILNDILSGNYLGVRLFSR